MTSKKSVTKTRSCPAKSKPVAKSLSPKKPAAKQTPAPQRVVPQQASKRAVLPGVLADAPATAPVPAPVTVPAREVSGEELYNRIQFQAYLLAEKDGFKADPVHYWVQAERTVKAEIRHPAGA